MRLAWLIPNLVVLFGVTQPALAQYTRSAGKNAPMDVHAAPVTAADGSVHMQIVETKPAADRFGNAQGNQHDLAIDGAFEGQTVAVIQLYTMENFDFSLPKAALKQKGFSVYRWSNVPPSPGELERGLAKASQLWIISGSEHLLTDAHLAVIKKFFDAGHGVYIWGDNDPYYTDANFVAKGLLGTEMTGNVPGGEVVGVENKLGAPGVLPNHLLTTGLENIFEGVTIATIKPTKDLQPLIYGSADNLVTAFYDHDGKRAILDGGFTRLYLSWDTAGTPRYVKNAASWLVNAERFGDAVVAIKSDSGAPGPGIAMTPVTSVPAIATGTTPAATTAATTTPTTTPAPAATTAPAGARTATLVGVAFAALLSILLLQIIPRLRRR